MSNIELLLAYPDTHEPVLEEGLSLDSGAHGDAPPKPDPGAAHYANAGANPDDLEEQGWGLIVPDDDRLARRLLGLIEPLMREREQQTGQEPRVYRVPPNMGAREASTFWRDVYQDPRVPEYERPRYLLMLGDADLISWELQQRLSLDVFVGRLAFQQDRDYEAYVHKVLEHERAAPADGARALFHTVRDGTKATSEGHRALMTPTVRGRARLSRKASCT